MTFDEQVNDLRGVYSPIFTPFDNRNQVNFDMLTQIAEFQLAHGMRGFFVTGSTGEGLLLSEDERLAVIRHMIEFSKGRATVIAHVGHPSTEVATRLAVASQKAGADWIGSIGPIYYGTSFQGALRHYRQIAQSVSDTPFMIYSIDSAIHPQRDLVFFEIPNVCGMKYTGADFYAVQEMARGVNKPIALLSGMDEMFVAGQSFGFQGGIGTTFNFAPSWYADIYRHYQAGNIREAASLQADINKVTMLITGYENWSYRKALMKYIGFDCGHCRAPFAPLADQEYEEFAKQVDALGILKRNPAPTMQRQN